MRRSIRTGGSFKMMCRVSDLWMIDQKGVSLFPRKEKGEKGEKEEENDEEM